MNKKEVAEIKKQFTDERCTITKIAGCYVDTEKNIKTTLNETFLTMEEEERFKYFELLKAGLGGKIGKNLMNLSFPASEEEEGGKQNSLYRILRSDFSEEIMNSFFQQIIETYQYPDNYFILVMKAAYDVPGQTLEGEEMVDSSDYVYEHMLCLICPIKPSKPGLTYDSIDNAIINSIRNMMIEKPEHGFLFPAFNDRNTDLHAALYFTKKADSPSSDIIENILGCSVPKTASEQHEIVVTAISEGLGEDCTFDAVKSICEDIVDAKNLVEGKEEYELNRDNLHTILDDAGANTSQVDAVQEVIEESVEEEQPILANNFFDGNKLAIKNSYLDLKVNIDHCHDVTVERVNGAKCLVIRINDDLEVNGVPVK